MRKEKNCYCTECKIPMKLKQNNWLVQTISSNRLMGGDLYECEGCGKKVVVTEHVIDQHKDREYWDLYRDRAMKEFQGNRILTLPDEEYMSW